MAKKRGNGEGSITKRKDGLYMARYTVETATGKKRKPSTPRPARRPQRGLQRLWRTHRRGLPPTQEL